MTDETPKPKTVQARPAVSAAASNKPVKLPDPVGVDLSKASRVTVAGTEGVETPCAHFPGEDGVLTPYGRLGGASWPKDADGNPVAVAAAPFVEASPVGAD